MGSLVSVSTANLVMENIEVRAISSYDFAPKFWKSMLMTSIQHRKKDQIQHSQII